MLAVWKSGSRSSKIWSWRLLLRPQWTQRVHILGETHFVFHLRKSTVLTTFLIIGQVEHHFWAVLRPLLSSQSLIFTQPAFEAQPLREASKHFWETWMESGSNWRYFSSQNRCENQTPLLHNLLFSFFLDDPVVLSLRWDEFAFNFPSSAWFDDNGNTFFPYWDIYPAAGWIHISLNSDWFPFPILLRMDFWEV